MIMMVYILYIKNAMSCYLYNENILNDICQTCAPLAMFCFEFLTALCDLFSSVSKKIYFNYGKENIIREKGKIERHR